MKKKVILAALIMSLPLVSKAQSDDVYFIPQKSKVERMNASGTPDTGKGSTYYSGSNRDVDEYNRRGRSWTHYQQVGVDAQGRDIISLRKGNGLYPDSMYIDTLLVGRYNDSYDADDDYKMTRRMRRFNGYYEPYYDAWAYTSSPYWSVGWGWNSPWYDPWYHRYYGYSPYWGYYDPWYYGRIGGYYGYGWYGPRAYYGWGGYYGWNTPIYVSRGRHTGTLQYYDRSNYDRGSYRRSSSYSNGSSYNRDRGYSRSNISFGSGNRAPSTRSYSESTFGGSSFGGTRSGGSFGGGGGSFGGGSTGGSFGGGSFGGGTSSGGGGGFRDAGRR